MKSVAIFGGSGGLGGAVARRVGKDRPAMVGYHSNRKGADDVVADLMRAGHQAVARQVDVRNVESVHAFLAEAGTLGTGLGSVISVSGAPFPMCALTDADAEEFKRIVETEIYGSFNILKHSVQLLKDNGGDAIVLFLTTAVLRTMDYDGLNSVPKAAIAMMLRHVAREAGRDNIRVNGIAPGVIDAGRTTIVSELPPLVQQVVNNCLAGTPLPRLGQPCEVAALASYLISDEAGYVNGQIIGLDGGYSA